MPRDLADVLHYFLPELEEGPGEAAQSDASKATNETPPASADAPVGKPIGWLRNSPRWMSASSWYSSAPKGM